jgi:hypothetical protein
VFERQNGKPLGTSGREKKQSLKQRVNQALTPKTRESSNTISMSENIKGY